MKGGAMKGKAVLILLMTVVLAIPAERLVFAAEDGADETVYCPNNSNVEPCLPDNAADVFYMDEAGVTHEVNLLNGTPTCEATADQPHHTRNTVEIAAITDVDCNDGAYIKNGTLTGKEYWTVCNSHTECGLNSSDLPANRNIKDGPCGKCYALTTLNRMYGRRGYCRYYWDHGVFRADNWWPLHGLPGDPISFWSYAGDRICLD